MARLLTLMAVSVMLCGSVVATDLGNRAPEKPIATTVPPPADPEVVRQGGDTIFDAVIVTLPVVDMTGTTVGYTNDYDEECPYDSTSPDVVYTFVTDGAMIIDLDLFGSTYDTKIYVYDQNLDMVACNDDFYSDYVSKIEEMPVEDSAQYFVVIDGYGGDAGDYVLNITEFIPPPPCILECPASGVPENEPPLEFNYADVWNGGCQSPGFGNPFQPITSGVFCGVSGFYTTDSGNNRDTDWFTIEVPAGGVLEVTGDAEVETYMFELGPQDCGSVGVVQHVIIGPCTENSLAIVGAPGSSVWFWVGPTDFYAPDGSDLFEYDYVLLLNVGTATQDQTWTGVKALFD